eukprot:COSAG06_NODE_53575_length_299_cov_0.800000_1_plen_45_part_01
MLSDPAAILVVKMRPRGEKKKHAYPAAAAAADTMASQRRLRQVHR